MCCVIRQHLLSTDANAPPHRPAGGVAGGRSRSPTSRARLSSQSPSPFSASHVAAVFKPSRPYSAQRSTQSPRHRDDDGAETTALLRHLTSSDVTLPPFSYSDRRDASNSRRYTFSLYLLRHTILLIEFLCNVERPQWLAKILVSVSMDFAVWFLIFKRHMFDYLLILHFCL